MSPAGPPPELNSRPGELLHELDQRQDEVLAELDQLQDRIEDVLNELGVTAIASIDDEPSA